MLKATVLIQGSIPLGFEPTTLTEKIFIHQSTPPTALLTCNLYVSSKVFLTRDEDNLRPKQKNEGQENQETYEVTY